MVKWEKFFYSISIVNNHFGRDGHIGLQLAHKALPSTIHIISHGLRRDHHSIRN